MPYARTALLLAAMTGLFFGRGREYQAERVGAELCGRPLGRARRSRRAPPARRASTTARPNATATAPLFIANPLRARGMN